MNRTPNFDLKVKAILDATKPGERVCPISGETWILTSEDIERYRGWGVPPPIYSPTIRMKELAGWGAGIDLWWKPHFQTGKAILSGIHPDSFSPAITDKEWFEKDWGAEHPLDVDLAKPILEQTKPLFDRVPYPALSTHGSVNCVGCGIVDCVDSYMVFGSKMVKDSWYAFRTQYSERVMDAPFLLRCENVFASAKSVSCNNCVSIFECNQCINSAFLFDCQNCEECFCSSNLRHKQYVFMNEQLNKEEYQKRMAEIDLSSTAQFEQWKTTFRHLVGEKTIWPENFSVNVQNCVGEGMMDCLDCSGFLMDNSRNIQNGWNIFDSEHLDTVVISYNSNDCYGVSVALASHNIKFSFVAYQSQDCEYVVNCYNCEHCFGCVGLNRKKFNIFNKQYSEQDYWRLVDEIKCAMLERGEYGRFFPAAYSPLGMKYGYGYVVAPLTKEELTKLGGLDLDPIAGMRFAPYDVNAPTSNVDEVPDRIVDITDEWVGKQFFDAEANRRYAVNAQELAYRKEHGYPFPLRHYTSRLKDIVASCNGPIQESARCAKCNKEIMTSSSTIYSKRTVYCKACYLKFIESNG
ncbi:MAG: hypothetical protein AAB337_01825 [Patescibacteria group bacterium]